MVGAQSLSRSFTQLGNGPEPLFARLAHVVSLLLELGLFGVAASGSAQRHRRVPWTYVLVLKLLDLREKVSLFLLLRIVLLLQLRALLFVLLNPSLQLLDYALVDYSIVAM